MGLPRGRTNNPNGRPRLKGQARHDARINIYMPTKLWEAVSDEAEESDRSMPAVIRALLTDHFKK